MKLWVGQSVSSLGSQVSGLALPLVAVLTLHASAGQMGILGAFRQAPFLLLSLLAGVWVDRRSPRSTLILADTGRAVLLAIIPVAAVAGVLQIEVLYIAALLVGMLTVFFDIAYYSLLPALVDRDRLVEGNGKLAISDAVASVAGPGLGGFLVQLVSAPLAILADALSFAVSAASLLLIGSAREMQMEARERAGVRAEIGEGLRIVFRNPYLRANVLCGATHNFSSTMLAALFILYLTRSLHLVPGVIGLVFAAGSVGALLSSTVGGRVTARVGVGRTIAGTQLLTALGGLFYPLAGGSVWTAAVLIGVGETLWSAARPIHNIAQVSMRQAMTPDHLLGRMTASTRFVTWGVTPIGAVLGGVLGGSIGIRPTLIVVVAIETCAALWIVFSPLWGLRTMDHHRS